jgi:glycolate oxidase FAD binding subunit
MAAMQSMDAALHSLTERIRAAVVDKTHLRLRGGGSKDFYWQSQQGEALDTRGLSGIVSYEPSELVVTVGAGTLLTEVEALLAEHGQCLPFEPPHFSIPAAGLPVGAEQDASPCASPATVGGMVAAGLSGPARASVGAVREYVLGVQMVNGRAEHLTFGGQVMKNVAGYDVSRLMVGSMGTLGLITQVSLKVLPVAPAETTMCFELDQASALEQLHRWGGRPLPLNASCWVHDDTAPGGGLDLLFVRLRGAVAAVQATSRSMLTDQGGCVIDPAQAMADWQLCRNLQLPFFLNPPSPLHALWRLSVAQTAPVLELPFAQLVEWHGGLRWLWAPLEAGAQLHEHARRYGGHATLFIAARAHPTWPAARLAMQSVTEMAIEQRLKASFDPAGVFGPALRN